MPRKKTDDRPSDQTEAPRAEDHPGVRLRLTQNEFVAGKLYPRGKQFTFSASEARRRLATQQFWETVS